MTYQTCFYESIEAGENITATVEDTISTLEL